MSTTAITPDQTDDRNFDAGAQSSQDTPIQAAQDALSGDAPLNARPQVQNPADQAAPPAQKPSLMSDILHAVGEVLGGPSTVKKVNPQTGVIEEVPLSRSQRIANTAGIYIRGAAAGAAQHGPGAVGKAGLAGVKEEEETEQRQTDNTLEQSKNVQTQLAGQASRAMQAQQVAESGWRMQREGTEVDSNTADKFNAMQDVISQNPNNKDLGHYASFADLTAAHPELQKAGVSIPQLLYQGKIRAIVTTANGKSTGIQVYQVDPDWEKQKNDKPVTIQTPNGLDAKGNVKYQTQTIPANAVSNGNLLALMGQQGKAGLDAQEKSSQLKIQTQAAKSEESLRSAETTKDLAEAKALGTAQLDAPDLTGTKVELPLGGVKEYNKRADDFIKSKEYTNLLGARASKQQFDQAIDKISKGDFTGADSVAALFNAVGISATPLQGKGMRITKDVLAEHIQARGLDQALYQRLLSLKNGDIITPDQLKSYAGIADSVVYNGYVNAVNDAHAQGLKADFLLPTGNNKPIDPLTLKIFFTAANGNPQQAAAAAKAKGWLPPAK